MIPYLVHFMFSLIFSLFACISDEKFSPELLLYRCLNTKKETSMYRSKFHSTPSINAQYNQYPPAVVFQTLINSPHEYLMLNIGPVPKRQMDRHGKKQLPRAIINSNHRCAKI